MTVTQRRVVAALAIGPIRAIGGSVYDARNRYVTTTTDLEAIRHIVQIERIDAGGSPTWIKI